MARAAIAQGSRVDAVLTGVLAAAALLLLALPASYRDDVAATVRRSAGVPLLALQSRAEQTRAAFLTQDSTSRVIDSLALETADVRALRAENAQLRSLLGLAARLRWGFIVSDAGFIPAEALGDRGPGRTVAMTLNVGSRSGVTPYSPEIAPGGLVGRVRSVDPNTSVVELFSSETFRVSAMTQDQRVVGIVRAHTADIEDQLQEEYLLEMSNVEFRNQLAPGTVIYTSGLGGTVPAYIPVGTVLRELESGELWARTYLLRPAVRPTGIRSVVVLLPQRAAAGVEGVWVAAPDSAALAVVAAGDSLAAANAAADSAARAAEARDRLLDSLRALGLQVTPVDSAAPRPQAPPVATPTPPAAPPAAPPTGTPRPAAGTIPPAATPRRDTIGRQPPPDSLVTEGAAPAR